MTRGMHRDAFTVETPSGVRFELALERFLDGYAFEFREIGFCTAQDGEVVVTIDSSWGLSNVTEENAMADLNLGQSAFRELVSVSGSFASAVSNRSVRYELIHDYGAGSVLLCTVRGNRMTWAPGLPARGQHARKTEDD